MRMAACSFPLTPLPIPADQRLQFHLQQMLLAMEDAMEAQLLLQAEELLPILMVGQADVQQYLALLSVPEHIQ